MSNVTVAVHKRSVYVPVSKKPATGHDVALRPSREMLRSGAGEVMRAIPWSGTPEALVVRAAPPTALDARAPARHAFARIPWTGEALAPPTTTQCAQSVAATLSTFQWG